MKECTEHQRVKQRGCEGGWGSQEGLCRGQRQRGLLPSSPPRAGMEGGGRSCTVALRCRVIQTLENAGGGRMLYSHLFNKRARHLSKPDSSQKHLKIQKRNVALGQSFGACAVCAARKKGRNAVQCKTNQLISCSMLLTILQVRSKSLQIAITFSRLRLPGEHQRSRPGRQIPAFATVRFA